MALPGRQSLMTGRFNPALHFNGVDPTNLAKIEKLLAIVVTDPTNHTAVCQLQFELGYRLEKDQPSPEYLAAVAEINRQIAELTRQIAQLQRQEEARRAERKKQSAIQMAPRIIVEENHKFQLYLDQQKATLTQDLTNWWDEFAKILAKYEDWAAELPSDRQWDNLTIEELYNNQMPFLCRIDNPHEWFCTQVATGEEIYSRLANIGRNIVWIEEAIKKSSYYSSTPEGFWVDSIGSINELIEEITVLGHNFQLVQAEYTKLKENASSFKDIHPDLLEKILAQFPQA